MTTPLSSCLLLISCLTVFFGSNVVLVGGQCQSDQLSLLLQLKNNLIFNSKLSTKLVRWNRGADSWDGVTCEEGRVTGLDLSNESISGGVENSSVLFSLQYLQSLNLASCKLRTFPDFLKSQSKLSFLDLSDNQIRGAIPKWIWKLGNLAHLNLSHNFLVNAGGPLQNISSTLSVLDLHSNMLHGPIPLPKFTTYLDFSSNKFSSAIPADIGNYLFNVVFFSLSSNNFHGTIPQSICKAKYLEILDLSRNNLSGVIPQCLTLMTRLEILNLGKNNLNGNISDTFGNCALQNLDVSGNLLEGKLPKSLANCTMLEVLDLGNNDINDTFPCYLTKVSNLRVLVLRSNKFSGFINCSGDNVGWSRLQFVDLASNNFSGKLPKKLLGTWKAMMADQDKAQAKLKHLAFESFTQTGSHFKATVTVTIKGQEMKLVKILTIFTSIDMSCNNFQGSIPEEIGELKELLALNLSHNALIGQLPSSLGNLQQLESLDLSCNNFQGSIPEEIGELKELLALNLSHNAFVGQLPSSLGNMQQLESLDLSRNQLNGEIPMQLASLHFLSVMDLSFNQLVGRIPISTQLQSFSEVSFQGNSGLCGSPLAHNCTKTGESLGFSPQASEDSGNEIDWEVELVYAEIGFIVGFGIVIWSLVFWKRWRQWYYKHVDQLLFRIFPKLDQGSRNRGRRLRTRIWSQRH